MSHTHDWNEDGRCRECRATRVEILLAGILAVLENLNHAIEARLTPKLTRIQLQEEPLAESLALQVGDKKTLTVQGFDQFGQPFAIDFNATPASFTDDAEAVVSDSPAGNTGADAISAIAAGVANIAVTVAGFTDSMAITVSQPAPVLSSIKLVAA